MGLEPQLCLIISVNFVHFECNTLDSGTPLWTHYIIPADTARYCLVKQNLCQIHMTIFDLLKEVSSTLSLCLSKKKLDQTTYIPIPHFKCYPNKYLNPTYIDYNMTITLVSGSLMLYSPENDRFIVENV